MSLLSSTTVPLRNTVRQARTWLTALLAVSFSALAAVLDRFDLVGTGAGQALTLVNFAVTVLAVIMLARLLLFARREALGKDGFAPAGGLVITAGLLTVAAFVIATLRVAGELSAGSNPAGLLATAAVVPPVLLAGGLLLAFIAFRLGLSELTHTQLSGWMFMMPALMLMLIWIYLPAVNALWISLFKDFNYLGTATFVGLENYAIALRDPLFIRALINTGWYVIGTVPVSIAIGVFIAILLNEKIRGLAIYRLAYFLPYITALTAAAAVWSWIFNPGLGLLNYVLGLENFRWTSNPTGIFNVLLGPFGIQLSGYAAGPSVALFAIMIMSIWNFLGYNVVIFLAGLQSISKEYYEAARIDGANWWHQLRYITWPLLVPTTFFVLIISLIGSLNVFTQILIMTPTGGVLNDTLSVVMYLYQKGFRDFDFGYASALAFILFVITLGLTLMQRRMFRQGGES